MADLTDKLERLDIINKPGEVTAAEAVDVVMPRTRFQVGDRVECFCGDAGYLPATVAGLWYTPENEEEVPYRCELDRGGFVYAPVDDDTCVRAPREHIIRKKPGVSNELMRKIFGPDLGSCSDCNVEIGPMAVYEQLNGRSAFMGIVRYGKLDLLPDESSVAGTSAGPTLVKLDDPAGGLDGEGHVMDDEEFLCEWIHYDGGSCGPGGSPPKGWLSPPFKNLRDKDASLLRDGELDPRYGVDETFPFDVLDDGSLRARVRADDSVKVIYERNQPLPLLRKIMGQPPQPGDVDDEGRPVMAPTKDRQWLEVVAVTRQGIVTARPRREQGKDFCFKFSPELTPDKFCYFPCDRILAMTKYSNW